MSLRGQDSVKALNYQGKLTVFARSLTTVSRLYWTQEINGKWSNWQLIGGTRVALLTDVAVAYNGFSKVRFNIIFKHHELFHSIW